MRLSGRMLLFFKVIPPQQNPTKVKRGPMPRDFYYSFYVGVFRGAFGI